MRHTLTEHAGHPDDRNLLLMLDGELNAREARTIGSHLEECRTCRAKMLKLQTGLDAFAEYGLAALSPAAGAPPKGWSEFPLLLDRIRTEAKCRSRSKAS